MSRFGEPLRLERATVEQGVTEVRVTGEVDIASGPRFGMVLGEALADGAVLVDLRGCGYIDSMGIGALVRSGRREGPAGRLSVVCDPDGPVRKVIDAVGLERLVPVHETRSAALEALARARPVDA